MLGALAANPGVGWPECGRLDPGIAAKRPDEPSISHPSALASSASSTGIEPVTWVEYFMVSKILTPLTELDLPSDTVRGCDQ